MIEAATCNEAGSNSVGLNTNVRMQLSGIGQVESKGFPPSYVSDATPARFLLADGFVKSANLCAIYILKSMGGDPKMALMLKWADQPHIDGTRLGRCEIFRANSRHYLRSQSRIRCHARFVTRYLATAAVIQILQERFDVSMNPEEVRRLDFCKSNLKVPVTLTELAHEPEP